MSERLYSKKLLLQNTGKAVAVGFYDPGSGNADFHLTRYNLNGSSDLTFGTNGQSIVDVSGTVDDPQTAILLSDQSIFAAGYAATRAALVKFTANGQLDVNFGNNGKFSETLYSWSCVRDILQVSDGYFLLCDTTNGSPYDVHNMRVGLIKLTVQGSLDVGFGNAGKLIYDIPLNLSNIYLKELSDKKLLIVGNFVDSTTPQSKLFFKEIESNGANLVNYGDTADDLVKIDNSSASGIRHALLNTEDKVTIISSIAESTVNFFVTRYNRDGMLDTGYGVNGSLSVDFGTDDFGQAALLQSDNKMIVAGVSDSSTISIVRLLDNGTIDTSFGVNGKAVVQAVDNDPNNQIIVTDVKANESGISVLYTKVTSSNCLMLDKNGILVSSYGVGNETDNSFSGTNKSDYLYGFDGEDSMLGGAGADLLDGGAGNDNLLSGDGNDVVYAGGGDDLIVGGDGKGDDKYFGGEGTDKIRYLSATWGISVDLGTGKAASLLNPNDKKNKDAAGIGKDTLNSIENLIAGIYSDILVGNTVANQIEGMDGGDRIDGKEGNDTLIGGAGSDTLIGGLGNDSLTGGTGNDRFVFDAMLNANSNVDMVTDFGDGSDKMVLGKSIFKFAKGIVNKDGSLNISSSILNRYLVITDNSGTWSVAYDADGAGTKSQAIKFAEVTLAGTKTTLDFSDFIVG